MFIYINIYILYIYIYIYIYTNDADITNRLSAANTDISQTLKGLALSNSKNVILSYLNANSVRYNSF